MKFNKLLLSIMLSFLSLTAFADNKPWISIDSLQINTMKQQYSPILLMQAIDQVGENDSLGIKVIDRESGYDYYYYADDMAALLKSKPNILNTLFKDILQRRDRTSLIKEINNWAEMYILLGNLVKLEAPIYLEQVLYEIEISKPVVDSFLGVEGQNWGSLSSAQLEELPYKTCNYFYSKGDDERLFFYQSFLEKIQELSNERER